MRHLAKDDKNGVVTQMLRNPIDQGTNRREIAVPLIVGRHIGSDIDHVAAGEIA
jgi:hypothetical protein